jgi:hypothetical protein
LTDDLNMRPIAPKYLTAYSSPDHIISGIPIPKATRVTTFSPHEWECFIEEWASSLKEQYVRVKRSGGAGDMGIDVAGFCSSLELYGDWHNYQCKHYNHALHPSDIWVEVGKIIYHSFKGHYSPPTKYFFIAPHNIGTALSRLLCNAEKLKEEIKENWRKHCEPRITTVNSVLLDGELLEWFEKFDFSIFSSVSVVELIEGHSKTPFHSVRFGGGLPPRNEDEEESLPESPAEKESRYIRQIFDAYGDHLGVFVNNALDIEASCKPQLGNDLLRQRERFYSAEALRNFARDNVPEGTFSRLQDEIFDAVIDSCEEEHNDGLSRMRKAIQLSTQIALTANPLVSVVKIKDRQGVCHQLANEDRLTWVPKETEEAADDITIQ